jgi:hypothetical protein
MSGETVAAFFGLTEEQLLIRLLNEEFSVGTQYPEIFAALAARFSNEEVKWRKGASGKDLAYVTARTVMNRLDEIIGPENWFDEYVETKDGLKCSLTIMFTGLDGHLVTVNKQDGAGFEPMKDENDAEKSGYSAAFKRAAVKFGIGRYLYGDGMPPFVRVALGLGADGKAVAK